MCTGKFAVLGGTMSREQFAGVLLSLSSAGGESLHELWKMLDNDNSFSPSVTPLQTLQGTTGLPANGQDKRIKLFSKSKCLWKRGPHRD